MAIQWGNQVGGGSGSNGWIIGVELVQSPSTVTSSTTSVTVTTNIYIWTKWSISDSSNTLTVSGDATYSGAASVSTSNNSGTATTYTSWPADNRKVIKTFSKTYTLSYTSTDTHSVSASLTGINAYPGTSSASASLTVPKRPYDAPAAPTGLAVSVDGTTHALSWTNNATTSAPYSSLTIEQSTDGGATWTTVSSSVAGTATSYQAGSRNTSLGYLYRIKAVNPSGSSAWTTTLTATPKAPAAPTNVSVAVDGATHTASWTRNATSDAPYTTMTLQQSTDGGTTWTTVAADISGSATSYAASARNTSVAYRYRVCAVNASGSSAWAYAPNPTPIAPSAPSGVAASVNGSTHTLSWTRNATSAAPYASITVEQTTDGGTTWTAAASLDGTATGTTLVGRDVTKNYRYRAIAANPSGSATSAASAETVAKPDAPTSVSATAVAGGFRIDVAAPESASSDAKRWVSWRLARWDSASGAWTTVVSDGTLGSLTTTNEYTTRDRKVQYRAWAVNAASASGYAYSSPVYTKPNDAANVAATRASATTLSCSWTNQSSIASSARIDLNTSNDGQQWSGWTTVATTSQTQATIDAGQAVYAKVRIVMLAPDGTASDPVESGIVVLSSPPGKPYGIASTPIAPPLIPGGGIRLSWTHAPTDGTAQRQAEVWVRRAGEQYAQAPTIVVDGPAQSAVFTPQDSGAHAWKVRTYGLHASPSPESDEASFTVFAPPTISIASPQAGDIYSKTLVVTRNAPGQDEESWTAELVGADGRTIEQATAKRAGGTLASSIEFATELVYGRSYTVKASARTADGVVAHAAAVQIACVKPSSLLQPPPAPAWANAQMTEQGAVVSWDASGVAAKWCTVYRTDTTTGATVKVAKIDLEQTPVPTSYIDASVEDDKEYRYAVAFQAQTTYQSQTVIASGPATHAPFPVRTRPAPPADVQAQIVGRSVLVSWRNGSSYVPSAYVVARAELPNGAEADIAVVPGSKTTYLDETAQLGKTYRYSVRSRA